MSEITKDDESLLSSSWNSLKKHKKTYLYLFLFLVFFSIFGLIIQLLFGLSSYFIENATNQNEYILSSIGSLTSLPFSIFGSFVGVLIFAIPSLHIAKGEVITPNMSVKILFSKPWRYLLAGTFYSLLTVFGYLFFIVPGILMSFITPIYVNRIFTTDLSIVSSLSNSFKSLFSSSRVVGFLFMSLVVQIISLLLVIFTLGFGYFLVFPLQAFYLQEYLYKNKILK